MPQPDRNPPAPSAPENDDGSRPGWRFVEGSVSVSVSMLLALLLSECACGGLPLLGYLAGLTQRDDGVIIAATLLLFPTTLALYGVFAMFYAAKEFVEKRARRIGRAEGRAEGIEEGRQEGRRLERERINRAMASQGVPIHPELAKILADDTE